MNNSKRILIVGGGMAGWTLAGLLKRQGVEPTLVEKVPEYGRVGFWIGLYPFSAATLRETGAFDRYDEGSMRMADYVMSDSHGSLLQRMSFADLFTRIHGFMGALHRAELLDILRAGGEGTRVLMGTTLAAMEPAEDCVRVEFSNGMQEEFDLVVGADGIRSATRQMILGETPVQDWGYTAFTWWTPPQEAVDRSVHEFWGAGGLFGLYPMTGRINAIGGMPTPENLASLGQPELKEIIRSHFAEYPSPVRAALKSLDEERVFAWPMVDHRSPAWIKGRVALLGDSATGFLPTAGVGASNAMKSASVLADELGRADRTGIPLALEMWEKRARHRVEANQTASRNLAKMMFVKGHTLAKVRDVLLKHYPVEKIADEVMKSNTEPW